MEKHGYGAIKKFILLFCSSFIWTISFSQGRLEKLFYAIPSEHCMDFDLDRKKMAILEMKDGFKSGNRDQMFIDETNGFLSYDAYQCSYEMCYWNVMDDKHKDSVESRLIAIIEGCMSYPIFFQEVNGQLKHIQMKVFLGFNAAFFFKENVKYADMKDLIMDNHSFKLPRKGLNITAVYGRMYGDQERKDLLKGDKIDFIWNNGNFTLGQPYF